MTCPRCGAELRADQDWCVECGAPARTQLARPGAWRAPVALIAVVAALSGAALAFAFVRLSNTDDDVAAARSAETLTQQTQPAAPPPPATTATSPFTTTTGRPSPP